MTLEKNDWCERNLRASFARPVECIWHRLIEPGTKNYWNCQKNWSLTIKQKSIHCMKKGAWDFFLPSYQVPVFRKYFFLVNENFFFYFRYDHPSLLSSTEDFRKKNPGCVHSVLFLWFGFSWENERKQEFLVFFDYYTRSWDRFIIVNKFICWFFSATHSAGGLKGWKMFMS